MASSDSASWVAGASSLRSNPASTTASAAMASDPPALPTIATRRPGGSGWLVSTRAVSSMAASVGTRMTPVCSRRAASVSSRPTDAIEVGSRPAFTVTTGLARLRRRARRLKWRGFPRLSMYMQTTSVLSSLVPVLEQVVAGHVGTVAEGDEGRDADPPLAGLADDRGAHHPGLREQRHAPPSGDDVGEGGVQAHVRVGVDDPEAVRTHHADAPGAGDTQHLGLEGRPLRPELGEPRREDHDAVHLLAPALLHDGGDGVGRDRDHREVHVVGDVEDAGRGADRGDVVRVGVHGPHGSREAGALEVLDHGVADACSASRPAPMTATLRGESSRRTASAAAVRARSSMAASAAGVGCRPRRTSTTPSAKRVAVSNPACVKTPIIFRLSGSTEAVKAGEPHLPGPRRQVLEQHRGETAPVVGVVHEEGHLGLGAVPPAVVAGHPDQLVGA